jgi:GT2 family glycosyltransferase
VVDNNSQNNSLKNIIKRVGSASLSRNEYQECSKETLGDKLDFHSLPRLTFMQNDVNAGFAGGNNIVLRLLANLDAYVWLLNPDTTIREDTLAELVDFAERQTADCIIGAEVRSSLTDQGIPLYGGGRINFFAAAVRPITNSESAARLDYISGGCLFTQAASFKKYGVLPEEYFLYWEETDWCFRAKQEGAALLVCPSAVCYHKTSSVIGRGFLSDYYYCRNGLLFISKFRKRNVPIALCAMTMRVFRRIISGEWGKARGACRGTIDFLRGKFNRAV